MATDGPTVQPGQPGSKVLDPHDQPPPTWAYLDASDVLRQLDERDTRRRRPTVTPVLRISDRYLVGTLDLRGIRLRYALEFVRCRFEQAPDLRQASLPGVTFTGCWLPGLEARNLQSSGDVVLSWGTTSAGAVNLTDADIAGFLVLGGSRLLHAGKVALCADRIRVGGDVQAANIFVEGQVSLGNAQIGGSFDAREARIDGILRMAAAHVHGDMIFDDGIVNSPERTAIDGARLTIGGRVSARNLAVAGSILLPGAKIGTDLDLADSRIRSSPASPCSVDLRAASIGRATNFSGTQLSGGLGTIALDALGLVTSELRLAVVAPPIGRVNLWHARCQVLADNESFWDTPGAIDLDDFRYERLAEPIDPTDDAQVSRRLRWLRQGMRDHYRPDPYDQLARALRASGNEKHSATVLMVKQRRRYAALADSYQLLALPVALWSLLQRVLAGYGYRLGRAVGVLVLLLAATTATVLATNATSRGWVLTSIAAVAVLLLTTVAAGVGHRLTDFTGATTPPALTPSRTELEPSPAADRPQRAVSAEDLAVEAYLDIDDPLRARAVFSALDDVVELLGYERPEQETIQRGSWWRRTRARAKDWLTSDEMRVRRIKVERALELVTIDVRQAEVDVKTAEAVARLMASLQDIPQACLRAGSVLVVKYDGDNGPVVLSRTLSQVEIKALELFPEIQAKPRQVLEALATAITALEDGDEPAP